MHSNTLTYTPAHAPCSNKLEKFLNLATQSEKVHEKSIKKYVITFGLDSCRIDNR